MGDKSADFLYWNCGSGILKKLDTIKWHLENVRPEVFFVAEADITQGKDLGVFRMPNYIFHQANTINTRNKCRLVAWSKENCLRKPNLEFELNEILVFQKNDVTITGIYRHFKCYEGENIKTNFERLMCNLHEVSRTSNKNIILGDFNVDPIRDSDSYFGMKLEEFKNNNDLDQLIENDTRSRIVSGQLQRSRIDLAFTDIIGMTTACEFMSNSDHCLVKATLQSLNHPTLRQNKKGVTYLDWRGYSPLKAIDLFCEFFRGIDVHARDVDDINDSITTAICLTLNELVPKRTANLTGSQPVINGTIRNLRFKKSRLHKKWKLTGDIEDYKKLRKVCNKLNFEVKKERRTSIHNDLNAGPKKY